MIIKILDTIDTKIRGELGDSVHFLSATGCPAVLFLGRLDGLPLHVRTWAAKTKMPLG